MKCCSNCIGFKDECIEGDGWCETRNKPTYCGSVCELHKWRYDSFAQRCMKLPYGYDQELCDGKTCGHRRKCIRYMLHVKKRLEAYEGAAHYMVCAPKYNFALCFWSYEDMRKELEKKNGHEE